MVKNLPAIRETSVSPWVRKIPSRKEGLHTPIFLPGKFCGQRTWWDTVHGSQITGHD